MTWHGGLLESRSLPTTGARAASATPAQLGRASGGLQPVLPAPGGRGRRSRQRPAGTW